ncbi:MAG: toxic anion resistance protein [Deltaproteobacteria bacterium]|jgi:uncharacterized protein YaaN involved in tellurite resistance|nr:toxic anion resistance protein [Deltaproteobacteria bacterium]
MSEFSMTVFDPAAIADKVVSEEKPLSEEAKALRLQADNNAKAILESPTDSLEDRRKILTPIEEFGLKTMSASRSKTSFLSVSINKLAQSGQEGGVISQALENLDKEIKELDPTAVDFMSKGFLGIFFNPVKKYFNKYKKAETVISDIINSLEAGKDTLKRDNVTLEVEQASLRDLSKKLRKEIEFATAMDEAIAKRLDEAKATNQDPDKIRFIEEEILFPLRQRVMDLNQMLVVNHQGIISMEVTGRNNKELIRGVDRALNVTVTALRTSVMVAGALYNQKIVLNKIQALNETTASIISATSTMLKEQGTEIQKQAMSSTISVDVLKKSFDDVLWSLDEISRYKREALPKLQDTIGKFRELASQGEAAINRMERGDRLSLDQHNPEALPNGPEPPKA